MCRKGCEAKLASHITKAAGLFTEQQDRIYGDKDYAELTSFKLRVWRSMHPHGRGLNGRLGDSLGHRSQAVVLGGYHQPSLVEGLAKNPIFGRDYCQTFTRGLAMTAVPSAHAPQSAAPAVPGRRTVATEGFSGLIDYLLPNARRDYIDVDVAGMEKYVTAEYESDETADALVKAIDADSTIREQFEQALTSGIDTVAEPAPQVVDFIRTVDELPDFIDMAKVNEGIRVLNRIDIVTATGVGWALGFLLAGILPNSAAALAANKRTVDDPGQRMVETGKYVVEAFVPDGYSRYGAGTITASRLRVMHAFIRKHLLAKGQWNTALLGAPISTGDGIGAAAVYTCWLAMAAMTEGYRFTEAELDAVGHLSACSQFRHGAPPHLIPTTFDEQQKLLYVTLRSSRARVAPAETAVVMPPMTSLSIPTVPAAVRPIMRSILNGYGRTAFGDGLCDETGIPRSAFTRVLPTLRMGIRLTEFMRTRLPAGEQIYDAVNLFVRRRATDVLFEFDNSAEHYATGVVAVRS